MTAGALARFALVLLSFACAGCPRRGPLPSESVPLDDTLRPELHRWRGLAARGDALYFGTLRTVPTKGGPSRLVFEDGRCSGRSTIAVTPRWIYWSCQDGGAPLGKLMRVRAGEADAGAAETVVARYFSASSMIGDADGLWFTGTVGQLPSGIAEQAGVFHLGDDDGAKPELVTAEKEAAVERARIAVDADTVYWIRYGTFAQLEPAIMATSKKDGATRVLATQPNTIPTAIALSGTDVYFGGRDGARTGLVRVAKKGGPVTLVAGPKASGNAQRITNVSAYEGLVIGSRYAYWVTGCSEHFLKGVRCESTAAGRAELATGAVDLFAAPNDIVGPAMTGGSVYWAEQKAAGEPWTLHRVAAE